MSYKIAICDDDISQSEYLVKIVREWATNADKVVETKVYLGAEAFWFDYENDRSFDLILLDIGMEGMDGLELAKKIRQVDEMIQIIFITGFSDYISEGYEVAALHYLIKPIDKIKLKDVLDRAIRLRTERKLSLFVSTQNETVRILFDDIYYVETQGHYMIINTRNEQYRFRMTVSEIMGKLGVGFYRCSRCYVVGLKHVSRITRKEVILENKRTLPLGRGRYDEMNRELIKYLRIL